MFLREGGLKGCEFGGMDGGMRMGMEVGREGGRGVEGGKGGE